MGGKNNPNAPKKGSQIKVEPIKRLEDIELIKRTLEDKPRDLALFTIGINTNLRASDLLRIKVGQVLGLQAGDGLEIKEKKTGKLRRLTFNRSCAEAAENLLRSHRRKLRFGGDYLFQSQKGIGRPLTVPAFSSLVKSWCRLVKLKGNYGSHTLRKTWGYHQRKTFGVDIPTLMVCFNHSNQRQTLEYLCIQPEEIRNVYRNEL